MPLPPDEPTGSGSRFDSGGPPLTAAQALARLNRELRPVTACGTVPLASATGRIVAEDVIATRNVPPHDNAAVDGYAVHFEDLHRQAETRLRVVGRMAAGHRLDTAPGRGEAVRIFTGAPVPPGPDTVVMQEDCTRVGDIVAIRPGIPRGANRRRAGEDLAVGSVALAAGRRLQPQDIGLAASLGLTGLPVRERLRVALFSTGDELREPGSEAPAGTVYDANRHVLAALLCALGTRVTDLGILPDRAETICRSLEAAATSHDVIVTSGGMSSGAEDHVRAAVEALGRLDLWRLAIKPGRPVGFGRIEAVEPGGEARQVVFIGLPGNPVAMMVTFLLLARPALLHLAGAREVAPRRFPVRAGFAYAKKPGRREWLRVRLEAGPDGGWTALRVPRDGTAILSAMAAADGLAELPEDLTDLAPGATVDYLPFSEVLT